MGTRNDKVKVTLTRTNGDVFVWNLKMSIVKAREVTRDFAKSYCYDCDWMIEGYGKQEKGKYTMDENGIGVFNQR